MQILVIGNDISGPTSTASSWTSSPIDTSIDVSWGPWLSVQSIIPEVYDLCADLIAVSGPPSVNWAPASAHMLKANYKEPALPAPTPGVLWAGPRAPPK